MKRRLWLSLLATTIAVIAIFAANLATGTTPLLGLDLQGGASVILEPAEDASGEDLTVVRDLIRDELERSGIAEPNVRVQGDTIVVELPGVKDQQAALEAVDVSGIVELRPVVNFSECSGGAAPATPLDGVSVDPVSVPDDTVGRRSLRTPPEPTPVPDVPLLPEEFGIPLTPGAELLPTRDGQVLCVGPAQGTGEVFERQSAVVDNSLGFQVNVDLNGDTGPDGRTGTGTWNALAS